MALLLNERDVRTLLPMSDLINAMGPALGAFSSGRVRQPVRSVLELGTHGFFGVMPAAFPATGPTALEEAVAGVKVVTVVPSNHARGLPSHLATILLFDGATGALTAIVDGRYITEARTAAVSAVSAMHLARPESRTVAIIGSGVQARSHALALTHVRPIALFQIWSPSREHRAAAADDIQTLTGARAVSAPSAREAVEGADIVVLVTSSAEPVIEDSWIADGTHVIAVGACRPTHREMPAALVARARLVVDSRDAAMKEAGDILLAQNDGAAVTIAAELGDICDGRSPGRRPDDRVTIFKSLGLAVEDVVSAALVVRRARELRAGTPIELG
jgi:alanine dehydrogenase